MNMKAALFGICVTTMTSVWAQSVTQPQLPTPNPAIPAPSQNDSRYSLTVASTIFQSPEEKISLSVTVPHHFRALETAVQAAKLHYLEFIPENDDKTNWSQIITLQILGDKKLSASQYTDIIKSETASKVKDFQVLKEEADQTEKFLISTLAISYEYKDRREIVYMRYYSSKDRLTGIQYAKTLKPNEKPQDALGPMIEYVNNIAKVVSHPVANPNTLKVENDTVKWVVR